MISRCAPNAALGLLLGGVAAATVVGGAGGQARRRQIHRELGPWGHLAFFTYESVGFGAVRSTREFFSIPLHRGSVVNVPPCL